MRREQRLRRRKDFAAVYRQGRAHSNQLLVLRVLPNDVQITRFGFVAGKVVGGAVVRNRVKRRLRELARRAPVAPGFDVVIGARKGAAGAPFGVLSEAFAALASRAGLVAAEVPASGEVI